MQNWLPSVSPKWLCYLNLWVSMKRTHTSLPKFTYQVPNTSYPTNKVTNFLWVTLCVTLYYVISISFVYTLTNRYLVFYSSPYTRVVIVVGHTVSLLNKTFIPRVAKLCNPLLPSYSTSFRNAPSEETFFCPQELLSYLPVLWNLNVTFLFSCP